MGSFSLVEDSLKNDTGKRSSAPKNLVDVSAIASSESEKRFSNACSILSQLNDTGVFCNKVTTKYAKNRTAKPESFLLQLKVDSSSNQYCVFKSCSFQAVLIKYN